MTQPPQSKGAPPKLPAGSADLTADLLAALGEQVPHVFTESVNWDSIGNLIIEGDNLEVFKLLQRP